MGNMGITLVSLIINNDVFSNLSTEIKELIA